MATRAYSFTRTRRLLGAAGASVAMALGGCAPLHADLQVSELERSGVVAIRDLRPPSESQKEMFSYWVTSDAYGIWRIPDTQLSPPVVRLLQHRMFEKLQSEPSASEAPSEVSVLHFVVYQNMQSEGRRMGFASALGGVLGVLVAGPKGEPGGVQTTLVDEAAFDALRGDNEYKRALYSDAENPSRSTVHVVFIETIVQGKRVFTRTLVPTRGREDGQLPVVSAVETAIAAHLAM